TLTFTAGSSGIVSLTCSEVNALAVASVPGSATITITGGVPTGGHLYVVAHQDDDLLFFNPDIEASIRSGVPTRVVFAMAAGGPVLQDWMGREQGEYEPYLMMANASYNPNDDPATYYTCGNHIYNGFAVRQCTMTQNTNVSLVFLRLPDGDLATLWATDAGAPFYVTPASTLTTADGVSTYTQSSLVATMAAIFADFAPVRVSTLDSSLAYGFDHEDHVSSALFALEATHSWGAAIETRLYRGYSMDGAPDYYTTPAAEAVNLSTAEYDRKHAVMVAYGGPFPNGGTFDNWCHRRYAISSVTGVGPLAESGSGCVDTQGGSTANGTRAVVTSCSGQAAQRWTVRTDFQIAGPGGKCLTIGSANAVQIQPCTATAAQKWTVLANGQVRGQNGLCLTESGGLLGAALCNADTSGNPWLPLAAQTFTQRASSTFAWSAGTDFSDADIGGASSSYRTLQVPDLDGDGYADACIRRTTGLYCGLNGHNLLGTYTLFDATFSDVNGWSGDAYGGTVQYADVSGDGRPDACARTATGIVCALGNGSGFAAETTWSSEFSDGTVFAGPLYYRSLHFGDVNGDGYADVCGRTATGVSCALNTKSGAFAASTPWITSNFTDAGGWNVDAYASTVQLADVNGDGRVDVCGRGVSGLVCAVSNGVNGFIYDRVWSFRKDFADAAGWNAAAGYYGSIHFGDVNGDGLADVCGRNASGLTCALSDSVAFQEAMPVQPGAFTNALGWLPDAYGTSLRIADVNHDGRADACGRSSVGLVCTTSP
ncbi:MAG TPA: FG-GAP-like repeat-containing protein, partial [Polyangiaceae bacterium]